MRNLQQFIRRLQRLRGLSQVPQVEPCAVAGAVTTSDRQLSSLTASTSKPGASSHWGFAVLPLLGLAAGGTVLADANESPAGNNDGYSLLPLGMRQRIFFKYEKRIRDKSTLDKVFEYFTSVERDQQKFLTPADLVRAVVPTYPPSESSLTRSGYLDGERTSGRPQPTLVRAHTEFFKQFDVDGDGLISYPEFLLVLTLLSIREKDVKTVFDVVDLDGTGDIDRSEFEEVMELLQAKAKVHAARIGRSHKFSCHAESGLFVSFFGADGTRRLRLPQFRDFLTRLHEEVVRLEFDHYDTAGSGSIPAVDFARSLVATADVRHVDKLLDRVDALPPSLSRLRISLTDFLAVHLLQRKLHKLLVALEFLQQVGRPLSKDDFTKLLSKLLAVQLADHVLDIIFAVFGDGSGRLDTGSFTEVMQRREIMWARRRSSDLDAHLPGRLRRWLACFSECMVDGGGDSNGRQ